MEFDSDEERRMFCDTGEDDEEGEDIESEYSSAGEKLDFSEPAAKEQTQVSHGSNLHSPISDQDEDSEKQLSVVRTKEKKRERCLSSSTTTSTSASVKEEDIFVHEGNFTDSLISEASLFLSSKTQPHQPKDSPTLPSSPHNSGPSLSTSTPSVEQSRAASPDSVVVDVTVTDSKEASPLSNMASSPPSLLLSTAAELEASCLEGRAAVRPRRAPPITSSSKKGGGGGGKKHKRRCGECTACLREDDCGQCRFCHDMRKFGGVGRLRQKCIKRQCYRFSRLLYSEDPLVSGRQLVLQDDVAAELKALDSLPSKGSERASTDIPRQTPSAGSILKAEYTGSKIPKVPSKRDQSSSKKPAKKTKQGTNTGGTARKGRLVKKRSKPVTEQWSIESSDSDDFPYTSSGRRKKRRKRRPLSDVYEGMVRERVSTVTTPQQCLGIGCVESARPHSKYCSEKCGVELAIRYINVHSTCTLCVCLLVSHVHKLV